MNALKSQDKRRFLIDEYPRSMEQAVMFEEEMLNVSFLPVVLQFVDSLYQMQDANSVILLECSPDEMLRRLRKRAGSSGRIDDNSEAFKRRLDTYEKESFPVVNHPLGRGSVKIVGSRLFV